MFKKSRINENDAGRTSKNCAKKYRPPSRKITRRFFHYHLFPKRTFPKTGGEPNNPTHQLVGVLAGRRDADGARPVEVEVGQFVGQSLDVGGGQRGLAPRRRRGGLGRGAGVGGASAGGGRLKDHEVGGGHGALNFFKKVINVCMFCANVRCVYLVDALRHQEEVLVGVARHRVVQDGAGRGVLELDNRQKKRNQNQNIYMGTRMLSPSPRPASSLPRRSWC